jgi:hypothetical protein
MSNLLSSWSLSATPSLALMLGLRKTCHRPSGISQIRKNVLSTVELRLS